MQFNQSTGFVPRHVKTADIGNLRDNESISVFCSVDRSFSESYSAIRSFSRYFFGNSFISDFLATVGLLYSRVRGIIAQFLSLHVFFLKTFLAIEPDPLG